MTTKGYELMVGIDNSLVLVNLKNKVKITSYCLGTHNLLFRTRCILLASK
jgi:hypothetical protein